MAGSAVVLAAKDGKDPVVGRVCRAVRDAVNGQVKKALERLLFADSHPGKADRHLDSCQLLLKSLCRCQDCLDCICRHLLTRVRAHRAAAQVFHLKLDALHNRVNLTRARILQQFFMAGRRGGKGSRKGRLSDPFQD